MAKLRERWLDVLTTCVTVALLAFVYRVLVDYTAVPPAVAHVTVQNQIASRH